MNGKFIGGILLMVGGALMSIAPHLSSLNVSWFASMQKQTGAWIVIVEQTTERSKETAILYNATDYWKAIESRGLRYRWYDIDSEEAKEYKPDVEKFDLPVLIIQSKEGKKLYVGELPLTVDGLDAIVTRVTGL